MSISTPNGSDSVEPTPNPMALAEGQYFTLRDLRDRLDGHRESIVTPLSPSVAIDSDESDALKGDVRKLTETNQALVGLCDENVFVRSNMQQLPSTDELEKMLLDIQQKDFWWNALFNTRGTLDDVGEILNEIHTIRDMDKLGGERQKAIERDGRRLYLRLVKTVWDLIRAMNAEIERSRSSSIESKAANDRDSEEEIHRDIGSALTSIAENPFWSQTTATGYNVSQQANSLLQFAFATRFSTRDLGRMLVWMHEQLDAYVQTESSAANAEVEERPGAAREAEPSSEQSIHIETGSETPRTPETQRRSRLNIQRMTSAAWTAVFSLLNRRSAETQRNLEPTNKQLLVKSLVAGGAAATVLALLLGGRSTYKALFEHPDSGEDPNKPVAKAKQEPGKELPTEAEATPEVTPKKKVEKKNPVDTPTVKPVQPSPEKKIPNNPPKETKVDTEKGSAKGKTDQPSSEKKKSPEKQEVTGVKNFNIPGFSVESDGKRLLYRIPADKKIGHTVKVFIRGEGIPKEQIPLQQEGETWVTIIPAAYFEAGVPIRTAIQVYTGGTPPWTTSEGVEFPVR